VFELWWSYYQCEPFGCHWEQTANLAAMIHANTAMLAASRGVKSEAFSVVDFMPRDSMTWQKRTKIRSRGIKNPKVQSQILKQAFGFT
jgi:hypothetical protein